MKNKIESGLLPEGTSLPSRADLCLEFGTSEKTIRRVLSMLEEAGLIETTQRKRPVVISGPGASHKSTMLALGKIDSSVTNDVLKTGVLLCYPVIKNGIMLCSRADLEIPHRILGNMRIGNPSEFWKLSKRFYRFFVARNENSLILQAVDSLGLSDLRPLRDDIQLRTRYYGQMKEFMRVVEAGGEPEGVRFEDMSAIYGLAEGETPAFRVAPDSAVLLGRTQLEELLQVSEVRYSAVYMDIIGLIAAGRYQRGDQLPTHKELQKIYGVSVDTTTRAIQILQELGVVKTVRGNGIYVETDRNEIQKIQLSPCLTAVHVRRYLDTLQLLMLTIEGAAACAADHTNRQDLEAALAKANRLWEEDYLYGRTPAVLLDYITEHIGIEAFGAVYELLRRNIRIGRSIPGLLTAEKTPVNCEIHGQCEAALQALMAGREALFLEKAAKVFESIYQLVIEECRRLGYYKEAMEAYDGAALWK